jgi:pyrimidine-specific ribonucleoside hydrolase
VAIPVIPVIIDTDPGIDDAVAILLALASPELDVRALTTVAGNSTIERTTRNAGRVLHLAGRTDIPVGQGAASPLVRLDRRSIDEVHGVDGLGDVGVPDSPVAPDPRGAIGLITDVVESSAEPVTLIALGPLTNVALLDALRPDILRRIGRIVYMGGAARGGNHLPTAEYNVWFDPEAAARVFALGLDIVMVGLDVTERAVTLPERWAPLEGLGPAADAVLAMNRFYAGYHEKEHGAAYTIQHDALAVAATIQPDLLTTVPAHVAVEHSSELTLGTTVTDLEGRFGGTVNAQVAMDVDLDRFNELLMSRLGGLLGALG